MARKAAITVTDRAESARNEAVEAARRNPALARRLAGNPFGGGSRELPLKEAGRWKTYLGNNYSNENEFFELKQDGWIPLTEDDLACPVNETGFRKSVDGYLVRGPQGQEMLFKMDMRDYRVLVQAKTEANMRGIGSARKIKQDIAEAAGSQIGAEAGDYINSLDGQVIDRIVGGA